MKELQANELRIGNLVKWEDESNEIVQITGIYLDKEMDNKDYYVVSFIDPDGVIENDGTAFLDEFIGIPITKEWLLKFGFGTYIDAYSKKNLIVTIFDDKIECYFKDWAVGHLVKLRNIEYVHELQNLYYILHREELKLNEK